MRTRCFWLAGCLALVVFLCWSRAPAADWPQWGGCDGRNMVSTEKPLPESFVPGESKTGATDIDLRTTKNVKWVTYIGGAAYGNPTVAGGRVFIGTDAQAVRQDPRGGATAVGVVQCLDEATGRLLWRMVVPKRTNLPRNMYFNHQNLGICSSPAVVGNRVYLVTSADEVVCLDVHGQPDPNAPASFPGEAKILWRYDLINELQVSVHDAASCSVLVHGDVVYVGTSNGVDRTHEHMVSPNAPALVALDRHTGRLLATEDEKICTRVFHCQWSSPSLGKVGDRTLLFFGGGDGICYAFEALDTLPEKPVHLRKVWSYDCNPPSYRFRDGKPIHYTDGDKRRRRSPNEDDGLYIGPSEVIATPVFQDNRVYVAIGQDPTHGRGKGMLHCIDATKTGDITETGRIWSYDGLDRTISQPTIAGGRVYIPDVAGRIHCVNADTGKCSWVYETHAETWGSILAADGKLYFGNRSEFFVLAVGDQPRVLSRVRLGSATYSTPIAANGVLYVASAHYLWAVQQQQDKEE